MIKILKSQLFFVLIGLIFCLPIIIPYIKSGYFPSHDGEWAVVRAGEMFREIRDLQFPPRYSSVLNFGYGYPLFNFAYPFPYYLATVFHMLHIGFTDSIKLIFAASVMGSFMGMFYLSLYFWKNKVLAFASGILYVYLPYRLVDLFVRGSIGESIAFCIYPLLVLSLLLITSPKRRNWGIFSTAILIPILITTHNISAVFFGIIFLAYILALCASKKYTEALFSFLAIVWGGLISAYFIFPALLEKQNIKLSKIPIADRNLYFVSIQKLIMPTWGYGTPTDTNPFTYQIGVPHICTWLFSIVAIRRAKNFEKSLGVSFLVLSLILAIMMFPISAFVWRLPLLSDINYPWILLLPIGFIICFISGALTHIKYGVYISLLAALASILMFMPYAAPSKTINFGDEYYLTNEATTTSSNELMPLWVKELPTQHFDQKIVTKGVISDLEVKSNRIYFNVVLLKPERTRINQIYYPGWKAFVNEASTPISYENKQGIMTIPLPSGNSQVMLLFAETPLRLLSNSVTLLSLIGLGCFMSITIFTVLKHRKKKNT